ncbi:uncharacterized protein LOC129964163 [Argiope bruennichi]|uniref:Uncharacterized protein n=1 Tax=Argiope bruennichi TaxID=94029 RepID=A0A8T0DZS8_ARGBR|nr:uncharacterized protein LOC129964163 [Argiope bruennichi]XP_055934859.1 uncharacterized protein LOC129964163 [Argiope bruennichi]XP_055934866.1 uncharacterized protein LOC129964163 [Argiope bruennichi]XP_055934875.1 uncharacterized protein LOC129964163 [Argiope bruennichi]XP_055934882.1 uncharacterized protein LOC129964163 [Argiope bruennichi]KAF8763683.1 hypothetical protein HNY73_021841 [Argiope bruennichi]
MLSSVVLLWLFLIAVTAESFNSFHKYTPTEKSDIPYEDSPVPKPRKPPTHISEFTDPNTGLNPFLDIEEGPTSAGRNVMKDEILEDRPFLGFDLVEGDAPDRRLNFDTPKESSEDSFVHRWPPFEDNIVKDFPTTTIKYVSETPPTTTDSYVTTFDEPVFDIEQHTDGQKIQKAATSSAISKDSLIYASATVAVVATLALLFGVCWWRRKLKRTSQSPIAAENGELKC